MIGQLNVDHVRPLKRLGGTRWNAGVEDSILKCPDRLAPNDVSGVYRDLSGCWMEGLFAPVVGTLGVKRSIRW